MSLPVLPTAYFNEEFEKIRKWLANPRRAKATQLVTDGVILEPPFNAIYQVKVGLMEVIITGSNVSVVTLCNRVVTSRFRTEQLSLFIFDDSDIVLSSKVFATLSESKQLILAAFPPRSTFDSDELYDKVRAKNGKSQAHARRRWKELKYNLGFDVDFSKQDEGGYKYWRGPSTVPVRDPNIRPDDKKLRKAFLPGLLEQYRRGTGKDVPCCNRCDRRVYFEELDMEGEFDDEGLLDHRRPVFQGGNDTEENLQIFCQTCNNLKNKACRKCPYDFKCDTCAWAFPEMARSRRLVLILGQDEADALRESFGNDIEAAVLEVIKGMVPKK
jgi:hypothetical protein